MAKVYKTEKTVKWLIKNIYLFGFCRPFFYFDHGQKTGNQHLKVKTWKDAS